MLKKMMVMLMVAVACMIATGCSMEDKINERVKEAIESDLSKVMIEDLEKEGLTAIWWDLDSGLLVVEKDGVYGAIDSVNEEYDWTMSLEECEDWFLERFGRD